MRFSLRSTAGIMALASWIALPAAAQQAANTVVADLLRDVNDVHHKLVDLAKAIPAEKFSWRPGPGVRSVAEAFLHVSSENYYLPSSLGVMPPAASNIKAGDYNTVTAYENRQLGKDAVVAELESSFAHLKAAMTNTPSSKMRDSVDWFGGKITVQRMWVATTTHMHEHLGQLIAYARVNGVVPPWSKGQ